MLKGNQKSFSGQDAQKNIEEAFGTSSQNSDYRWPSQNLSPAGFAEEVYNEETGRSSFKPIWICADGSKTAMGTNDTSGLFSLVKDSVTGKIINRVQGLPSGKTQAQLYNLCAYLEFIGYAVSVNSSKPTSMYKFVAKAQQSAQLTEKNNNMPF